MNKPRKRSVGRGLPSGEDPAVYDKPRTVHAWRWEFLRRRDDYRADWTEVHAAWQQQAIREHSNLPLPAGVTSWKDHFAVVAQMPGDAQRRKYGVLHLIDPARAWEPVLFLGFFFTRAEQIRDSARRSVPLQLRGWEHRFQAFYIEHMAAQVALSHERILTVHVDCQQPLGPQIEHIREWGKAVQSEFAEKPPVKNRREREWRTYLRILDLERRGLSLHQIAARVYRGEEDTHADGFKATKKARAALARARRLQDTLAIGR